MHYRFFNQVLARSVGIEKDNIEEKDYRHYDDYSLYVNEAVILWALSKKGLTSNSEYSDPNRNHLIFDKQIQSEMLMYMFGLKHRLYTLSALKDYTVLEIVRQKIAINTMERQFIEASNFGEINNLTKGYSQLLDKFEKLTEVNLSLKKEFNDELDQKRTTTFSWIIAIFFGLFSISSFSKDFLLPLWNVYSQPNNSGHNQDLQIIFAYSTSALITIVFLALLYFLIYRRRR
ncbi:hypothetical protein [Brevibacillus sp. SIMBA_040]|uniref:hypothetical protein n=1 Tax=unclassified Brevibacillus TaxID=2684853 RepID=UPI00397C2951